MKLIQYLDYSNNLNLKEKIKLIKEVSFDGVFIYYKDNSETEIKELLKNGLYIEAIHLQASGCNNLWLDNEAGVDYIERAIAGIRLAAKYNIKKVVFHISSKDNPPPFNKLGLRRIEAILRICEELGVDFAIENLRRLDYLDYIFANINSSRLKFCFDTGHANAFTKNLETFPLEKYKKYLVCIHLNDNYGDYDSHLIPFTAGIDFLKVAKRLKEVGYNGNITSEAIIKEVDINYLEELNKIKTALIKIREIIR